MAVELLPCLWLCSADGANQLIQSKRNIAGALSLGVKLSDASLTVCGQDDPRLTADPQQAIDNKYIDIFDAPTSNLLKNFKACVEYMHSFISTGRTVIVHCVYGQSRSVSCCIGKRGIRQASTKNSSRCSVHNQVLWVGLWKRIPLRSQL